MLSLRKANKLERLFLIVYPAQFISSRREIGSFTHGCLTAAKHLPGVNLLVTIDGDTLLKNPKGIRKMFPKLCGVIVYRQKEICVGLAKVLNSLRIPMLCYGSSIYALDSETKHYVSYDEGEVIRRSLEYLWVKGHRQIGILDSLGKGAHEERRRIWQEWMIARGQTDFQKLKFVFTRDAKGHFNVDNAQLKKFINASTAVVVTEDSLVPYFLPYLQKLKIQIGKDYSIFGINNTEIAQLLVPSLTSLDLGVEYHGKVCFESLFELVTRQRLLIQEILPTNIIERQSVAKPRKMMKIV